MEKTDDIITLVAGDITSAKKREVLAFVNDEPESKALYKKVKVTWALMSSAQKMSDYKVEQSFQQITACISSKKTFRLNRRSLLKYAAGLTLMAGLSATMFYLGRQNQGVFPIDRKFTSVVAGKGQISKVILPDSSVVWLNSGTTLRYDNSFAQNNRDVSLIGQAYFDVTKDRNLPFVVSGGNLNVRVTGTRFDVCAYPDENNIRVVLESGTVELSHADSASFIRTLNPGEMAQFDSQKGTTDIRKVHPGDYSSWKEGELVFTDSPMAEVVRQLERRFDVTITINDASVYNSVFNATFKHESLVEILDYIQFSSPINYRMTDDQATGLKRIILTSR
jgi:ferric-dicitrate binding protein FerR (iron transport regulator)